MKYLFQFLPTLLVMVFFFSCDKKDEKPVNDLDNGVFVVNEGNFTDTDGEITFINLRNGEILHRLFEEVNNHPLGGILQSMTLANGNAYIIDQLGRLLVVNANDFSEVAGLSDPLVLPRYIAVEGNKGFITDWGPYSGDFKNNDSRLIVVDLDQMTVLKNIPTRSRPEGILISSGYVFVANTATEIISVYSSDSLDLVNEIHVASGPSCMVSDQYGYLWVSCLGSDSTRSAVVKIDPSDFSVKATLGMPEGLYLNGRIAVNGSGSTLYFMSEEWATDFSYTHNTIFRQSVNSSSFSFTSVLTRKNLYGLGVNPSDEAIFVADAAAFQSNGKVIIYSMEGSLLDSVTVDRGPRDFVFTGEM